MSRVQIVKKSVICYNLNVAESGGAANWRLNRNSPEISMEQESRGQLFYKVWEVLGPFIIYYVTYNVAFLLIAYLCNAAMEYFGSGLREYLTEHAETMTELVNGLSMLIGVLPLMPMLRKELAAHGEKSRASKKVLNVILTVILAASSSIGLNILLTLTGFVQSSATYQDVAKQQYSVWFGVGALLFGLISPITEEIVFRGLVFNRMRRYCKAAMAIVMSGLLFGVYHGNMVQGLYGTCMGILLAYTYERMHSFVIPCLFHAVANITVYTLAQNAELHAQLFTVPGCIILLVIFVICIFMLEKLKEKF